jgi:RNA polymerase sigma-70 factor, ECF subfamily
MTAAPTTSTCDDGLVAFMSVRARLFGIAYRMLRSAAEAEDVVQDAWVRWQTADRSSVRDAVAFLATTTRRLAINVMQSARSRRETGVERWLPEPVDTCADPRFTTEGLQAVASGVQLLLERLTPTERAAYILREAFDYPYREIANVLRLEEPNARQMVARARQHVAHGRRTPANAAARRRLLDAFVAAARDGDIGGLERLLAWDAGLGRGPRRLRGARRVLAGGRRSVRVRSDVGLGALAAPSARQRRSTAAWSPQALIRHNPSPHPVHGS